MTITSSIKTFCFIALLALAGCASAGDKQSGWSFAYDDDGTTLAQVAPLMQRGMTPGCWFGEGGGFPYSYVETEELREGTTTMVIYWLNRNDDPKREIAISQRVSVNPVTGRPSFRARATVRRGAAPNPDLPTIIARLESDYENYRRSGTLPCPSVKDQPSAI